MGTKRSKKRKWKCEWGPRGVRRGNGNVSGTKRSKKRKWKCEWGPRGVKREDG